MINIHKLLNKTKKTLCLITLLSIFLNQLASAQPTSIHAGQDEDKIKLRVVLTPPYIIGPGDKVQIVDRTLREEFGQVETFELIVSADGYITVPLPDGTQESILAAGNTLEELSVEVRKLFEKTLRNPLVYVQITDYRPINVYVGGEVMETGVYKIETDSPFSVPVTEAIQLAGGLKPRADITMITVTRGGSKEKKVINLKDLVINVSDFYDVNLQPGDAIYVPIAERVEDQAQNFVTHLGKLVYPEVKVSIIGQAKSAMSLTLDNNATLLDVIGNAGGVNDLGTLKRIKITRFDENGVYKTQKINLNDLIKNGTTLDKISLRPHDVIEVQTSPLKASLQFLKTLSQLTIASAAQGFFQQFFQVQFLETTIKKTVDTQKELGIGPFSSLGNLGKNINDTITVIESERKADEK